MRYAEALVCPNCRSPIVWIFIYPHRQLRDGWFCVRRWLNNMDPYFDLENGFQDVFGYVFANRVVDDYDYNSSDDESPWRRFAYFSRDEVGQMRERIVRNGGRPFRHNQAEENPEEENPEEENPEEENPEEEILEVEEEV